MLYYDINKKMYFGGHMNIKEEIHALSDEMIANLGRLVAIDSQLGTPRRECLLEKVLPGHLTKD